jgi:uncharacterized membrane protein YdjX (TVP38/TMEM64 family)
MAADAPGTATVVGRHAGARNGDRAYWRIVLGLFGLFVVAFVVIELNPSSLWKKVHDDVGAWQTWAGDHWLAALVLFFLVYATFTSLPLPVVTVMTLLSGAMFGRTAGTVVASLGYTAGVTVAFLFARRLLQERVRRRFGGKWLRKVEHGVARDGAYYLLTLRLMPSVPFFLVNLLMALTPIRTRTYVLVSWVGVLPMSFLYAGLGTEVAHLESPSGLLSVSVIATLVALALLPLVVRAVVRRLGPPAPLAGDEPDA